MTDAEKELRRLAENKEVSIWAWGRATTPSTVLALLDRIEALEQARLCDHGREVVYCVEAFNDAVDRAERKGAEEMRTAAVDGCREWSIPMPIDVWQGTKKELSAATARALADRIRSLPLPGDAP